MKKYLIFISMIMTITAGSVYAVNCSIYNITNCPTATCVMKMTPGSSSCFIVAGPRTLTCAALKTQATCTKAKGCGWAPASVKAACVPK